MVRTMMKLDERELYMIVHALVDLEINEGSEFKHFKYEEIDALRKKVAEEWRSIRKEKGAGR